MLLLTQRFLVDGRALRLARLGGGAATPVVLLHGYPDTLQVWSRVAPLLAARRPVIAFDWPGWGCSERWPGGATPQARAGQLVRILDELRIEQAHVAGLDMGGQPALAAAALHPRRVASVVACNCLLDVTAWTSWEIRVLRRFRLNRALVLHAPRTTLAHAVRTSLPRRLRASEEVEDFRAAFLDPAVRSEIVRACAGYEGTLAGLPALLARITCPALLLWGDRDRHFPVAHAESARRWMPHAEVDVVPDGAHWLPLQRPDEVVARLDAFWSYDRFA